MKMEISLVNISNVDVTVNRSCSVAREGFSMTLTDNIVLNLIRAKTTSLNYSRTKTYCEKLEKALQSKKDRNRNLSIELDWGPSHPDKPLLRFKGQLLESLEELCSPGAVLLVEGHFTYRRDYAGKRRNPTHFSTKGDGVDIVLPSLSLSSRQGAANELVCENHNITMSDTEFRNHASLFKTITMVMTLAVDDEYIHEGGGNMEQFRRMCKSIQQNHSQNDVFILPANSQEVLSANKCFLAVHSPVLKAVLEGDLQEAKTNRITMAFSVECVKALLEYVYTLDFRGALNSSKLAVELFQAANYYEIKPLEDQVAKMLLLRAHSWFEISSAIELFQTLNKIGMCCSSELKEKAAQVLLSKHDHQKDASFKKLFEEDWNTAMEMCAMLVSIKSKEKLK